MNTPHYTVDPTSTAPQEMPEALMTIVSVMRARGCKSRTTIWNEIHAKTFPPPDKVINRIRYWRASTIRAWQDAVIGPSV